MSTPPTPPTGPVKDRIFANPTRPNSSAAGGAQQIARTHPAAPSPPAAPAPPAAPSGGNSNGHADTSTRAGQYAFVASAAKLYGISPATLWGVYGTESNYGKNLGPSSAGAVGPFQFLPSTARSMHVDPNSFTSSALGAARYLHDLGADGDPKSAATAAALNKYSGGGGQDYVNKVLGNGNVSDSGTADTGDDGGGVGDALGSLFHIPGLGGIGDAVGTIGSFFKLITSPDTWFRIGKGVLGFMLIIMGTGALVFVIANKVSGGGVTKTAKTAVKVAAVA